MGQGYVMRFFLRGCAYALATSCCRRAVVVVLGCWMLTVLIPVSAEDVIYPAGSAFGMVPPPGFEPSGEFPGFKQGQGRGSILFSEFPASAYPQLLKGLEAETLQRQAYEDLHSEPFVAALGAGQLVTARQTVKRLVSRRWMFAFLSERVAGLVSVTIPDSEVEPVTDAQVRAALASLRLPTAPGGAAVPDIAGLPFGFVAKGRLQPFQTAYGSALLFVPIGTRPGGTTPNLLVVVAATAKRTAQDREAFAHQALQSLPALTELAIDSESTVPLDTSDALRLDGRAVEAATGTNLLLRQWVAFYPDGHYLRVLALAPESSFGDYEAEFEAIAHSLRRR